MGILALAERQKTEQDTGKEEGEMNLLYSRRISAPQQPLLPQAGTRFLPEQQTPHQPLVVNQKEGKRKRSLEPVARQTIQLLRRNQVANPASRETSQIYILRYQSFFCFARSIFGFFKIRWKSRCNRRLSRKKNDR